MDMPFEFFAAGFLGKPVWLWLAFIAIVIGLLAFDLGVLHRDDHVIEVKESLYLSAGYIGLGLAFGAWVWWYLGADSGMQYVTGFLVEKSLAMDNVFVIAMLFTFFAVPLQYQHRVLFWGVLGVILLRGIMIGLGAALVTRFSWVLYLFGALLVLSGIKMLVLVNHQFDIANNSLLRWLRNHLRVADRPHGNKFWVKLPAPEVKAGPPSSKAGAPLVWWVTPLFLALAMIEFVDLIFAVDSVPAVFAITQDPFIVYTSNIFAILGLRALYFALAAMIERFQYLKYALAIVLIFIGSKIFAVNIVGKIPAWISLGVTLGVLLGGVLYSLYRTRKSSTLLQHRRAGT
ncbi:MAG: TerC family protein [Pseudomonadota bacterium]|nr:TerC family protein [Pseudomonadota bacterium]